MERTNKELLAELLTSQRLYNFIDIIELLKTQVESSTLSLEEIISNVLPVNRNEDSFTTQVINYKNNNDKAGLTQYLAELLAYLNKVKQVKLTIAFEPPLKFIKELYKEYFELDADEFVFDITVDENIIGGFILINEGVYKDESLNKELSLLMNRHDYLANIFTKE